MVIKKYVEELYGCTDRAMIISFLEIWLVALILWGIGTIFSIVSLIMLFEALSAPLRG